MSPTINPSAISRKKINLNPVLFSGKLQTTIKKAYDNIAQSYETERKIFKSFIEN